MTAMPIARDIPLRVLLSIVAGVCCIGALIALVAIGVQATQQSTLRHGLYVGGVTALLVLLLGVVGGWLGATSYWSRLFAHLADGADLAGHGSGGHGGMVASAAALGVGIVTLTAVVAHLVFYDRVAPSAWLRITALALVLLGAALLEITRRMRRVERQVQVVYYWLGVHRVGFRSTRLAREGQIR